MKKSHDSKILKRACLVSALSLALILAVSANDASAQDRRGGGPRLSPEDAKAAWKVQAMSVSKDLDLSKEKRGVLTEAYVAARESHQKGLEELSSGEDGGRRNYEAYRDVAEKERAKLKTAIKDALTEEQIDKAMPLLGSFNRRWDTFVHALAAFELDRKAKGSALKLINVYVVGYNKAMSEAIASRSFDSVRDSLTKLKETLDTGMAKVLSEDQLAKWKEATAYRGRSGGRR